MPILIPNVYIDVSRSRYSKNTGISGKPQPNLSKVPGNLSSMMASDYIALAGAPEPALKASYIILVNTATDIVDGDLITMIYMLDGKNKWPGFGPGISEPGYGGVTWWVRYHREDSPWLMPYRSIFVERVLTNGPSY